MTDYQKDNKVDSQNDNLSKAVSESLDWIPFPKQAAALARREYEICFGGSRGPGKTDTGMVWMVEPEYIANPRYRGLVIRQVAEDLSDWIARAKIMYAGLGAVFTGKPATIRFPSGATIICGHLKDKDAFTKYQGHEYQKILIEELTQIPREGDYESLIASARSTVPGLPAQVFATTNPGNAGHAWVKRRFVDVAREKVYYPDITLPSGKVLKKGGRSRIFIPALLFDNPALLEKDPEYVRGLLAMKDIVKRKAWVEGDWDVFSGQYFKVTGKNIITPFSIPDSWHRYRGFDWGFRDPSAMLWAAVDPGGKVYVYREMEERGLTPTRLGERINMMTGINENIVATPSDPSVWAQKESYKSKENDQTKTIPDYLEEVGVYLTPANNKRIHGWQTVREYLYCDDNIKPQVVFFDTCPLIIEYLGALVHDETKVEDVADSSVDHLPDALRYLLVHCQESPDSLPPTKSTLQQGFDEIIRNNLANQHKTVDTFDGKQTIGGRRDWSDGLC